LSGRSKSFNYRLRIEYRCSFDKVRRRNSFDNWCSYSFDNRSRRSNKYWFWSN
jgi:hypothetical protein